MYGVHLDKLMTVLLVSVPLHGMFKDFWTHTALVWHF